MTGAEKVNEFLNEAGVWYFLTTDGNRPKGRPFRFHMLQDDKVYFGTGTFKNVYRQMVQNNHVEVLAVRGNEFLRYDGDVVFEEDETLAEAVLSNAPAMQKVYNDETGFKLGMFHLINGHAQICNAATIVEEFDV